MSTHATSTIGKPGAKISVLLFEDNPGDAYLLEEMLASGSDDRFVLKHVERLSEGLDKLTQETFDVILLDLSLPDGDGLETIKKVHANAQDSAIVVLTSCDDEAIATTAIRDGAQDYLVKGRLDAELLKRTLHHAIERQHTLAELDKVRRREHYLAYYDALTDLPNRQLLYDRLKQELTQAVRYGDQIAVLFIDLDGFKRINDTLSHSAGDCVLQVVASRLKECVRDSDTVARLGGDEFVIVLGRVSMAQAPVIVARKILKSLEHPIQFHGQELFVTASVGICLFPDDGADPEDLIKKADTAMYRAKKNGKDNFQCYDSSIDVIITEQDELEVALRKALRNNEFYLEYQPQFDLQTNKITGVEALIRWQHPKLGMIPPVKFIPLAEETGLILSIGQWVLRTACVQAKAWMDAGFPPIHMAVNLSLRQFRDHDLPGLVERIINETGLQSNQVVLEITENSTMQDPYLTLDTMHALKKIGVQLAIDDFGTGYSSLSHLKDFPIDILKVDRSFVSEIPHNGDDVAISMAIIALARGMGLTIVAEGIEKEAQNVFFRTHGCMLAQGFFYKQPPFTVDAITQILQDQSRNLIGTPKARHFSISN